MSVLRDRRPAGAEQARLRAFIPVLLLVAVMTACQPAATLPAASTPVQAAPASTEAPTASPAPPATTAPTRTSVPTDAPTATPTPAPSSTTEATAFPTSAPTASPTKASTAIPARPSPAPTRTPPSATSQTAAVLAAAGQQVYATCAGCHGANGEGGYGPALIGTANQLAGYGNGLTLFNFIRQNMPQGAPGSLPAQQYLEVTAFLLRSNDFVQPEAMLSQESLSAIPLIQ